MGSIPLSPPPGPLRGQPTTATLIHGILRVNHPPQNISRIARRDAPLVVVMCNAEERRHMPTARGLP